MDVAKFEAISSTCRFAKWVDLRGIESRYSLVVSIRSESIMGFILTMTNDFTQILQTIDQGKAEPQELLPVVYEELRRIANHKMAGEAEGHTLQPTALVHEAWVRLAGPENEATWENRAHFFGAAAEAMRRILVDHARKKKSQKRGGGAPHQVFDEALIHLEAPADELLAVHEALDQLALEDPRSAELVKLRYFVGMTMEEAATALGLKKRSAEALWTYAKVRLSESIDLG
jgi:RNA polymerase sigma factor (TIGR02999 family)